MAYLSPGVYITERDESTIVPTVSNNVAFFAGDFSEGPVDQPYVITSRKELIDKFGYPTDLNYNEWFQASKYLDYANQLIITRGFEAEPRKDSTGQLIKNVSAKPDLVGNYSKLQATDTDIILDLGTLAKSKLPNIQVGDIVSLTATALQSDLLTVGHITPNVSSTGDITAEISFIETDGAKNAPAMQGKLYVHSYSHKNGKSFAFGRGANTNISTPPSGQVGKPQYPGIYTDQTAVAPDNMDITLNGDGGFAQTRLSATYPLIKNDDEWDYLVNKNYDDPKTNPLAQWASNSTGQIAKLNFFTRTPTTQKVEVAIANAEDFITEYDAKTGNPQNLAVAFQRKNQDLIENVYLQDLFQYYPSKKEVALVFKAGDTIETFVVGFDPDGLDGNGKSNYIETVINEQSNLLYVLENSSVHNLPATYLIQDRFGLDAAGVPQEMFQADGSSFTPAKKGYKTATITVQGGKAPQISKGALKEAYDTVLDKEKYEIDVIIGNENAQNLAIDLADSRKDCIAFIGARYEDTVGKKANEATNAIVRYITENDISQRVASGLGTKLSRTMFGAFFGNYFRIYDTYNKKYRWINVAGDMAGIRCSVTTANASWWVSAGMRRGIISGIDRMAFTPSEPMRDSLYKNSINPLVTFPGTGNLVWGNKTLQSYASAFDRINVRGMFSTIERAMAKAAKSQVFEFNDPYTRNAILSMFNPYLATIKAGRGLTDFLVICDESNNTADVISRNELKVDIYVKPNYAAEFIILNFVNVGTRSFAEVIGA